MSVRIDTDLVERQYGVVSRRQLLALGLTRSAIETRLSAGVLVPLHPGVYAVGHRRLRREGLWLAAVLWAGPGAALSHRDAAALHGLRPSNRSCVEVTTTRRLAARAGVEVHHTRVLDGVVERAGIPVTDVARTLVDLAAVVPRDQLARAFREAELLRIADAPAIEATMRRLRPRHGPGHAAVRSVLAEHRALGLQLTRSVLEDRFLALLAAHDLPRARTNVQLAGCEVDACWPAARLVVELDGWAHHRDRRAFQRDRDKANALAEAGWTVLRFTHHDVTQRPAATARRLRAWLAEA